MVGGLSGESGGQAAVEESGAMSEGSSGSLPELVDASSLSSELSVDPAQPEPGGGEAEADDGTAIDQAEEWMGWPTAHLHLAAWGGEAQPTLPPAAPVHLPFLLRDAGGQRRDREARRAVDRPALLAARRVLVGVCKAE